MFAGVLETSGPQDPRLRLHARRRGRHRLPLPARVAVPARQRGAAGRSRRFSSPTTASWRRWWASRSTLGAGNAATAGPRIDLLAGRADLRECDLVGRGSLAGEARGWLWRNGAFVGDRVDDPTLSAADLKAQAAVAGQEVTYTCVPLAPAHAPPSTAMRRLPRR
jgi:hypothetical protein